MSVSGRGLSSKEFLGVTEQSSGLRPRLCKVITSNLIIDKLREGMAVTVMYFQRLLLVYKGCHGSSEVLSLFPSPITWLYKPLEL